MAEEEKKYGVKNPNEGVDGKLASNMTGEAIEGLYDYGSISDGDKAVVNEIIKLLRGHPRMHMHKSQVDRLQCFSDELKNMLMKVLYC